MKRFNTIIAALLFTAASFHTNAQCNTNTSICSSGIAGPYTFANPGTPVSSCLDFFGPSYAYIVLHITQSGPLEMLIEGDATTGFLDVAIFNVPDGVTPCDAILDQANEISCNYASNASGCNQIGTYFSCPSSVPAPMVSAGDQLMIVVENWSGASSDFTLELGAAPAAQTGPADPTISPVTSMLWDSSSPVQLDAATPGGTWSGTGVSSTGIFDPAAAGSGTHTVTYATGNGPCYSQDTLQLFVNSSLAVEMNNVKVTCEDYGTAVVWETLTETNCDHFNIERSQDGINFESIAFIDGHGTTISPQTYAYIDETRGAYYYQIVEVDYDGTRTTYGPFYGTCEETALTVTPNPATQEIQISYSGFHAFETSITCLNEMGSIVFEMHGHTTGKSTTNIETLAQGIYTIVISDPNQKETIRFVKL